MIRSLVTLAALVAVVGCGGAVGTEYKDAQLQPSASAYTLVSTSGGEEVKMSVADVDFFSPEGQHLTVGGEVNAMRPPVIKCDRCVCDGEKCVCTGCTVTMLDPDEPTQGE